MMVISIEVITGAKLTREQHKPFLLIEAIKVDSQAMINEMSRHGYRHVRIGINVQAIHESDPSCKEIWKS